MTMGSNRPLKLVFALENFGVGGISRRGLAIASKAWGLGLGARWGPIIYCDPKLRSLAGDPMAKIPRFPGKTSTHHTFSSKKLRYTRIVCPLENYPNIPDGDGKIQG